MSSSAPELTRPTAISVAVTDSAIEVDLADGRSLSVPISWYPRLSHASKQERDKWSFIGGGSGMHWPELDEDISVEALIAGKPSNESQKSLSEWLASRSI